MAGELEREEWGRHLRADYRHDGLYPDVPYNILGDRAKDPEGREFSEATYRAYAFERLQSADPQFKARLKTRREFHVPKETDAFDGTAPTLADAGGNQSIGVVTDAGKYITGFLGAINVVTFGLCLDPACSAINVPDRPVFYEPAAPAARRVYIDLQQFGFDPAVIRGIWIAEVVGGGKHVKSVWMMGDGKMIDPMTERKIGDWRDDPSNPALITPALVGQLGVKTINEIAKDPDTGKMIGYYASVDGATNATGVFADRYMIGKTMGDTMIVASAMKQFKKYDAAGRQVGPAYDNPFYGIRPGAVWNNFPSKTGVVPREYYYGETKPQFIAVKTGDQLNAVRAVLKGVPAIFERQATKTTAKFYEYYPGIPDPEQARAAIIAGYDTLKYDVAIRYNNLIAAVQGLLNERGQFPNERALFLSDEPPGSRSVARPGRAIFSQEHHSAKATALVGQIVGLLARLRDIVADHFTRRKTAVTSAFARGGTAVLDQQIQQYNVDTQNMLGLCPQVAQLVRDVDFPKSPIKRVVPVTRVGTEDFRLASGVVIPNIDIHLFSAFDGIANSKEEDLFEDLILNTLYYTRFVANVPGSPLQTEEQAAVGLKSYYKVIKQWVFNVVGRIRDVLPFRRTGGMRGGARRLRFVDGGYFGVKEDTMPTTVLLFEMMGLTYSELFDEPLHPEDFLTMLAEVLELKNSPRIADSKMLEVVRAEINAANGTIVQYEGSATKPTHQSTAATLIYNAAVMKISSDIAKAFGGEDDLFFEMIAGEFFNYAYDQVHPPEAAEEAPAPVPAPVAAPVSAPGAAKAKPVPPRPSRSRKAGEEPPAPAPGGEAPSGPAPRVATRSRKAGEEPPAAAPAKWEAAPPAPAPGGEGPAAAGAPVRRSARIQSIRDGGRRRTFRQKHPKENKDAETAS